MSAGSIRFSAQAAVRSPHRRRGFTRGDPRDALRISTSGAAAGDDAWHLPHGAAVEAGRTIVARLGGGVDHEVYAVEDHRFGRTVAKLVRPRLVAAGEACGVIAREAAALQRLADPGVVRCLDVELRSRHPHLLLELVPGDTLRALLRRGPTVPVESVVALGAALADTLATIAGRGWVHLDVKPENVIAGPRPRLLDFNIAQPAADAGRLRFAIGTPAYMAPEQRAAGARRPGDPIGPPADVYALAVTLHEALTGRLPDLEDGASRLPPPLVGLLSAALDREPARRPTAAELGAELRSSVAAIRLGDAAADPGHLRQLSASSLPKESP
jgi:eukaryotic-like serine/threonine-protein kinase